VTRTLERFSGYTYSSLMAEDAELIRLMETECAERAATDSEGW
jgi:hypothetical protein